MHGISAQYKSPADRTVTSCVIADAIHQSCLMSLNGNIISGVDKIKDLGVLIDQTLYFNSHVEACKASASKIMGFIFRQSINFKRVETLELPGQVKIEVHCINMESCLCCSP